MYTFVLRRQCVRGQKYTFAAPSSRRALNVRFFDGAESSLSISGPAVRFFTESRFWTKKRRYWKFTFTRPWYIIKLQICRKQRPKYIKTEVLPCQATSEEAHPETPTGSYMTASVCSSTGDSIPCPPAMNG